MIGTFRKLRALLDKRAQRHALLLLVLLPVMALVETLGVASIMPFAAVLSNPELIQTNPYLSAAYHGLGFTDPSAFTIFLGAATFALVLAGIVFTALTNYATARYSEMRSFRLSTRLLESYLRRPYGWFLDRHSADMAKRVLTETETVIKGSLLSALNLVSQAAIVVFLISLLIWIRPWVAVTATLVLGGAYSLIYLGFRLYLTRIGRDRFDAGWQRSKTVYEALGGIKELKVGGLEPAYLRRFSAEAYVYGQRGAMYAVINELPRQCLEALAIGGSLVVILVLLATQGNDLSLIFPVLVLYAFAGLRLLPAVQKVYANLASLRFGAAALDALYADLDDPACPQAPLAAAGISNTRLPFHQHLELRNVTYSYPKAEQPTLINLSLTIPARTTVAFIGGTGAGKTTVVDVILGLLEPEKGEMRVDGVCVTRENCRQWQQAIGYVPQHIFLTDETVAANIALGAPPDHIDMQAVERAARAAKLHDFVIRDLPQGYQTNVGEQGVRLSGGQRQRIGIARALYHDPDIIVLDEATSALDYVTERAVMAALHSLAHRKTILIVAHRLTTARACDRLFVFEAGRLKAHGTYDDLLKADQEFRQIAV